MFALLENMKFKVYTIPPCMKRRYISSFRGSQTMQNLAEFCINKTVNNDKPQTDIN
jgi:hypothetical protein